MSAPRKPGSVSLLERLARPAPASVLPRREFLRAVVAVAGPSVFAGCGDGDPAPAAGPTPGRFFPQSVASGDPRPTSVVLWTRVEDPDALDRDLELELELALDSSFHDRVELDAGFALTLLSQASAGGSVKVRVENLAPATTYYYRFVYVKDGERQPSRTGRTRTAPDPESAVPVRFAVVSCQDFAGKYYHVYRHALSQELDFFVHLGDYVYETIDDPSFQDPTAQREVRFSTPEDALALDGGGNLAARSLENYRDLYRTYRSDPDLQSLHELVPMLAIWDDHEFSNDCYGASANYSNGREDEVDLERRANADRAWFEFMPVDYAEAPALALDASGEFPENFAIYRRFEFGRQLELVLTDLRRFRPDHVVPEGAFPGSVFMTASEAEAVLGEVPDDLVPYIDLDADDDLRERVAEAAEAQGFDPARVAGRISLPWANGVLGASGEDEIEAPDDESARGYAYHQLLKNEEYSSIGARYLVALRPFHALAKQRFAETGGASEALMGAAQRAWFTDTLKASTRTWKVWGNEYTLMQRVIDMRPVTLAPEALRVQIVLNADDWDGAPNERDRLLKELADVENVVVFTGDLHAFFAGTPYASDDESARVVEFVCGSVSSTTWLAGIQRVIEADPTLPPEAALLARAVGNFLVSPDTKPNPHIGYLDLDQNGYAVATAGADELAVTLFTIRANDVATPAGELGAPVEAQFLGIEFRVRSGTRELEQLIDGAWKRWDRAAFAWV